MGYFKRVNEQHRERTEMNGINEISRAEDLLRKKERTSGPRYEKLERFDGRITEDQFNYLKKTARQVMKSRSGEKLERITANSILRTAIEIFRELDIDLRDQDIPTERALLSIARHKLYELEQGNK